MLIGIVNLLFLDNTLFKICDYESHVYFDKNKNGRDTKRHLAISNISWFYFAFLQLSFSYIINVYDSNNILRNNNNSLLIKEEEL